MAKDQSLIELQKSKNFVHALDGDAHEFFMSFWTPDVTYSKVKARMHRVYNSPPSSRRSSPTRDSLDFDTSMRANDLTDPELTLRKLIEHINQSCERLRPEYGSPLHRCGYLSNAVTPKTWSVVPLTETDAEGDPLGWHALQTKLKHALQHHLKESKRPSPEDEPLYVRHARAHIL